MSQLKYTVTLSHHSISRAAKYQAATIEGAKQIGDAEFSGGFNDHKIVVTDENGNTVASRRLGNDEWDEY